ncbi:MAG TPA: DUF2214 family protein [Rickettsiales bacterium]|nr:DUF2214 family protein [Rickettsiales bacterium]
MTFLFTYLHFLGAMVLVACLAGELFLLCAGPLNEAMFKLLKRIDIGYGISAGLMIATGVARIFLEKGGAYYSENPFFHAAMALFLAAGLISAYPTVKLIRAKQMGDIGTAGYAKIRKLAGLQLVMIAGVLFCMIAMARGF